MVTSGLAAGLGLLLWGFHVGEDISYDFPFGFFPQTVTNDIVIVKKNEFSNSQFRQTAGAWDRHIHADLLDKLRADQSGLVVFDILFADPGRREENEALAKAIKAHGNVVLAAELESVSEPDYQGSRIEEPQRVFASAARDVGVVNVIPDIDSAIRRHYPGRGKTLSLSWRSAALAGAVLPDLVTQSQPGRQRWIRYYGPGETIPTLNYWSAQQRPPGYFKGKTVFVGADDLTEQFRTPYSWWGRGLTPGVEIHATMFLNLVRGDWLTRWSTSWELSLVLLVAVLSGFGLTVVRPVMGVGLAVLGSLAVTALALWLFWERNIWFSWVAIAGVQIPCAWVFSVAAQARKAAVEPKSSLSPFSPADAPTEPALPGGRIPAGAFDIEIPNYEIIRRIGGGGFGEVALCRNATGEYHALKVLHRYNFETAESYEREFKGVQKYMPISRKHPGLIHILYVGRNPQLGYYYYTMEAADDEVAGQSINPETYSPHNLDKDLKRRQRLPVAECISMTLDLLDPLEFLHQAGLIHRDIKPANIIFVNNRPKLADIGLVTSIKRLGETSTGDPGSPFYMAPESRKEAPADIYGLGKVIYVAAMGQRVKDFPVLPDSLTRRSDMEALLALNAIILKACEEDVSDRYQSAAELRDALRSLQKRL